MLMMAHAMRDLVNRTDDYFDVHPEEERRFEDYYPRNIYFNKYLNRKNIYVITNDSISTSKNSDLSVFNDPNGKDFDNTTYDSRISLAQDNKCGFRYVDGLSRDTNHLILTDENSRPIYCTRSEHGIHFITQESSPFDRDARNYTNNEKEYIKNSIKSSYAEEGIFNLFFELIYNTDARFTCSDESFDLVTTIVDYLARRSESYRISQLENLDNNWESYRELVQTMVDNRNIDGYLIEEAQAFNYL